MVPAKVPIELGPAYIHQLEESQMIAAVRWRQKYDGVPPPLATALKSADAFNQHVHHGADNVVHHVPGLHIAGPAHCGGAGNGVNNGLSPLFSPSAPSAAYSSNGSPVNGFYGNGSPPAAPAANGFEHGPAEYASADYGYEGSAQYNTEEYDLTANGLPPDYQYDPMGVTPSMPIMSENEERTPGRGVGGAHAGPSAAFASPAFGTPSNADRFAAHGSIYSAARGQDTPSVGAYEVGEHMHAMMTPLSSRRVAAHGGVSAITTPRVSIRYGKAKKGPAL